MDRLRNNLVLRWCCECFWRSVPIPRGDAVAPGGGLRGDEEAIQMLLHAGAKIDATDAHGDSPLSWASWYLRPIPILRKLWCGDFRIHAD
jgi:hypothetical protein